MHHAEKDMVRLQLTIAAMKDFFYESRKIPNLVSLVRFFAAPLFFYFYESPIGFALVFIIVVLSDALDGYLARRLGIYSRFDFDSVADVLSVSVVILILIRAVGEYELIFPWGALIFTGIMLILMIITQFIVNSSLHFYFLHTTLIKMVGRTACIYFLLLHYHWIPHSLVVPILRTLFIVSTIAFFEMILIFILSDGVTKDSKSILVINRGNKNE